MKLIPLSHNEMREIQESWSIGELFGRTTELKIAGSIAQRIEWPDDQREFAPLGMLIVD